MFYYTLSGLQHRTPPRAITYMYKTRWVLPFAMRRVFHLLWAVHLGLLLLAPKLLQEWGLADRLRSAMKLQPAGLQRLTALLVAPLLDLCSMAGAPAVWLPQVDAPVLVLPAAPQQCKCGCGPPWIAGLPRCVPVVMSQVSSSIHGESTKSRPGPSDSM